MTLSVGPRGVRLTVPPRAAARRIDAFLAASAPWVAEQTARVTAAPRALAHGDRLAHGDDELRLEVVPGAARVRRHGDVLRAGEADLDLRVERWYRREALATLVERSEELAGTLGATVAGVRVRDPRSRWGSCTTHGRLSYSWRLLLAPRRVLDYVVAHEVCHLLRADHSPAFWALVDELHPGHRDARGWLRENGHLLHRGPAWRAGEAVSPS